MPLPLVELVELPQLEVEADDHPREDLAQGLVHLRLAPVVLRHALERQVGHAAVVGDLELELRPGELRVDLVEHGLRAGDVLLVHPGLRDRRLDREVLDLAVHLVAVAAELPLLAAPDDGADLDLGGLELRVLVALEQQRVRDPDLGRHHPAGVVPPREQVAPDDDLLGGLLVGGFGQGGTDQPEG